MSKKHDLLNECLDRILRGEALESCLKDYPREAEDLRPLLEATLGIRRYAETAQLRPRFITQTQTNLEIAYQQKYYAPKIRASGIFKLLIRLAAATTLAIAISLGTLAGGFALTVRASENTMPGETLYPVKLATEQVKLTLAFSSDKKINYLTQFAEARAEEMVYAAAKGNDAQVEAVMARLESHLAQVRNIVGQSQATGIPADNGYMSPELQRIESIVQDSFAKAKAIQDKAGEPPVQDTGEKPSPQDKTGEASAQDKGEKSSPQDKTGEASAQDKGEKSSPQDKAGESPAQDKGEKSSPQDKAGESPVQDKGEKSSPQDKAGESPVQDKGEKSSPQDKAGEPPVQDKGEKSSPQDKAGEPGPGNKDKGK